MSDSKGLFSISIGDGGGARAAGDPGLPIETVFSNSPLIHLTGLTCGSGTSYSPTSLDSRDLFVSFDDGSGMETLPTLSVNNVPFSLYAANADSASKIGTVPASQVLTVATGAATPLSAPQFAALLSIADGTTTQYVKQSALPSCAAGEVLKIASGVWSCVSASTGAETDPTVAAYAKNAPSTGLLVNGSSQLTVDFGTVAGKVVQGNDSRLSDSRAPTGTAGGDLAGTYPNPTLKNTGTAGTYYKVTTDAQGRVTSGVTSLDASTDLTGVLPVTHGGTGTSTGSITGTGALTFAAGGSNQDITLTPSGTGATVLQGNVGVGTATPGDKLDVAGKIRATHLCASDGTNCKDLTTSWGSGGTVSSVSGGTGLTGTVTTSGSISLASIANNNLLANTSGSAAAPVATTLSGLIDSALTGSAQGNILYRGASGWSVLAPGTNGQFLKTQGAGADPVWAAAGGGSGTVTSVALTAPSIFSVSGSPVTTSGTLAVSLATQTANTVFAGPTTGSAAPTFRSLNIADIRSTVAGAFLTGSGCVAGQALIYSSVSDTVSCSSLSLNSSQVTTALGYTPVNKAGDTMSGALNLPANGLTVGTSQLAVSGGLVGVGTASPAANLHVYGTSSTYFALQTSGGDGNSAEMILGGGGANADWSIMTNKSSVTGAADSLAIYKRSGTTGAKIVVRDDGNVGVGTTAPGDKLDVAGKIRATHLCASDGTNCKDLTTSWGSGGTVTSVSGGTGLTGTVTTTGSISLASIANNNLLANTSGSAAAPVATSLSTLIDSALTGSAQGNILYRGASGWSVLAPGTNGYFLKTQGAGADPVWAATSGGSGTVTSVALTAPSIFSVSGSPITTSGTLAVSLATQTANTVFAGPTTGSAAPAFRSLNIADIRSTVAGSFLTGSGCTAGQALIYSSVSDTVSCSSLSLNSSQVTTALGYTPVNKAGDTMSGALNLPANGLTVGTSQLAVSGGFVGVGTASPADKLDVAGKIRATHLCASDGTNCKDLTTSWGSGGTVTSVAGGTGLTGTVTTTGSISLANIANNNLLANTSGSAAAPVATTLSGLIDSALTGSAQGNILYRGASGWSVLAPGTSGQFLKTQGAGADPVWAATSGGSGTVTSVALTAPSIFSVSGSPVTTSGTLAVSLATQTANTVFAGPTTGSAAPAFRSLNIADIRSSVAGAFLTGSGCVAGETLTYSSVSDTMSCSSLSLNSSQVTTALGYTPVNKAGDTMSGALNLPANGLTVGTSQLAVSGGFVGVGTANPADKLDVAGKIRATHLCASDGTNCKDLTTSWGAGGTVTSVSGGTGLTGTVTTTGSISLANIANNNLLANTSGSAAAPVATTLSGLIDSALTGSAQGNILYRGASGWSVLAPGTNGYFLKTQGASADPVWAAGNSGTVTSVAGGTGLTGTVTTTGSISLANVANNTLLANTSGSAAAPVATSLSTLIDSALTGSAQGNILYRGASGWSVLAPGTSGYFLKTQGASADPVWAAAGAGTITSLTGDVTASGSGSVTATIASGAVTLTKMANMATASFLGRNTAGTGSPEVLSTSTVRTMLSIGNVENTALSTWAGSSNITTVGTISSGTWSGTAIGVTKGGTGLTSVAQGDLLYASASNTIASLAKSTSSTRYLSNTGASNAPAWAQIDLSNGVTGTLPVANGGTGTTTGSITGTGALTFTAGGTNQSVTLTPSGSGYTLLNGNVGVGTTAPTAKLSIGSTDLNLGSMSSIFKANAGALGTSAGNEVSIGSLGFTTGNQVALGVRGYRVSAGSDWTTSAIGLGMDVDNSVRAGADLWLHANGNVGIGTTNPGQALSVVGTIESTSGGFKFPDGSTQTTASTGGIGTMTVTTYSTPGTYTYTVPAAGSITVRLYGAGGGGGGVTGTMKSGGSAGGNSVWDSSGVALTAGGGGAGSAGPGSGGSASGGDISLAGAAGGASFGGNGGGSTSYGGGVGAAAVGNATAGGPGGSPGGGGAGGRNSALYIAGGGGGGGFIEKTYSAGTYAQGASVQVVVGQGGSGATATYGGGAGGDGRVEIRITQSNSMWSRSASGDLVWSDSGNVGIGSLFPRYKLQVAGTLGATAYYYSSDRRLKTDIHTIENPLDKILNLRGVTFKWRSDGQKDMGFIAQEVETVLPDMVSTTKDPEGKETKAVKYGNLTGLLVEGVKEMWSRLQGHDERLETLEKENAELKARLDALERSLSRREGGP